MTSILIKHGGSNWHEPASSGYTNEAQLRDLLAGHPSLIPGVTSNAMVCKEFNTEAGPADVVAVDLENGLTIVECKMASNPQVRREIVGQVLDYASSFWQMSVEEFDIKWQARTKHSLFENLELADALRHRLQDNLTSGEFRIILAVDEINADLRRIVEYLNSITLASVAVIAVVYSRREDNGVEILLPSTYGDQLVQAKIAEAKKAKHEWTPEEFLDWVDEKDPLAAPATKAFIQTLEENGCYIGRGSASTPSLNIGLDVRGDRHRWPIAFYTQAKGTSVEIRFEDFKNAPEVAERYLVAAESIPGGVTNGVEIRALNYSKRPNLLLRDMKPETAIALASAICQALA